MGLYNSNATIAQMAAAQADADFVLHIGDLSYADDFYLRILSGAPMDTYEGSWDMWQDLMEPITSTTPYMTLPGNHEVTCTEATPFLCPMNQRNFTAYLARVRMPYAESGATNNLWYSFTYGSAHFIQINTETDYPKSPMGPGTYYNAGPFGDQLAWLEADLIAAQAQRATVPWIIVSGHRPWYSSHKECAECQSAFEGLLLKYNVDFYYAGHIHWYECLYPMGAGGVVTQNNYINPTGIVYMTNGAGGNVEGHASGSGQDFSAFIDDTNFGFGKLTVANSTAIQWQFISAQDGSVLDEVWVIQDAQTRAKKHHQ